MPSVASYDGSTDADEHLENYQAYMLIQNANEAALCKSFCLTLTGAARQWKLEASYLFGIKQGETEPLKKYLERFDKAVVRVKSCSDDTLIQAFREGIKDNRLVWTLTYDVPPTFAHLKGIAWKHAEADEYVKGRGFVARKQPWLPGRKPDKNQSDHSRPEKGKAVVVDAQTEAPLGPMTPDPPPLRADRARRNQKKYCNFHKDVGHNTKDCIQLRDQIELLIQDGHLREFVERIITPAGAVNQAGPTAHQNPGPSNRSNEPEQEHIVHTIFGRTTTSDTASSRRSYAREARRFACREYINMTEHISKICRQDTTTITFTNDETDQLLHPHNDALIGEIRVADNVIRRVLIDNGTIFTIDEVDAPDEEVKRLSDLDPRMPEEEI
ncbi:hypothetical protein TIFTF001_017771 [Ficus carica]|uniref:Retrotransposon gag domain-containing protein n=1 Tax=Ficus carica TaxID=3494 RepID=A0AA88A8M7_FICCA|nr:hypothetical protein TIFTF001_017771 [Ficus carica]